MFFFFFFFCFISSLHLCLAQKYVCSLIVELIVDFEPVSNRMFLKKFYIHSTNCFSQSVTPPAVSLNSAMMSNMGLTSTASGSPTAMSQVSPSPGITLTQASPIFACGTNLGSQIPRAQPYATAAPCVGVTRPSNTCNTSFFTLANHVPGKGGNYVHRYLCLFLALKFTVSFSFLD